MSPKRPVRAAQEHEIGARGVFILAAKGGASHGHLRTADQPLPFRPAPGSRLPALGVDVVRVGAFNVQVFGDTKAGEPEVMSVLALVAQEFDVLLVQEMRGAEQDVADRRS